MNLVNKNTEQPSIYSLYTAGFQNATDEMELLAREFGSQFGSQARRLREDFCGTFENCREWVSRSSENFATGIDNDTLPIKYGFQVLPQTSNFVERLNIIEGDVLSINLPSADIVAALNCSFCELTSREQFKSYLQRCFSSLNSSGMIVLEVYCGPEAQYVGRDEIKIGANTAIWEQAEFDPVTNRCLNYIHFRLDDGTMIEKAFVYEWRLWSPAECVDLLEETGFVAVKTKPNDSRENAASLAKCSDTSPTLFIFGFKNG